jgi:hypothetical protein
MYKNQMPSTMLVLTTNGNMIRLKMDIKKISPERRRYGFPTIKYEK